MALTYADATANAMLDIVGNAGVFMSLHTGDPGENGANELADAGYTREAINMDAAASQVIQNGGSIAFGPAEEEWTEVTHYGLWTLASGGTFICGGALDAPVTVPNLGDLTFAIAAVKISLKPFA